jgi:hypothetical protein
MHTVERSAQKGQYIQEQKSRRKIPGWKPNNFTKSISNLPDIAQVKRVYFFTFRMSLHVKSV